MKQSPHSLEIVFRIRAASGHVLSEWVVRDPAGERARVELLSYFPSGELERRDSCSFEAFAEAIDKAGQGRAARPAGKEGA